MTNRIHRRTALGTIATALGCAIWTTKTRAAGVADEYAKLKSDKYLGEVTMLAKVVDEKIFTEGPAVDRNGDVYFTNVPVEKILKWNGKELSEFRTGSNQTNGLLFEADGSLIACEGGAGRVTRTDMTTGAIKVLADKFGEFGLGAPNDVANDKAGRLYFTSRLPNADPTQGNVNSVYRIDPDGSLHRILHLPDIHMPNGIVTSPDDKTLYLIEAHPDADRNRNILAYDLDETGNVTNSRVHISFYPGRSGDGMCIDAEGNLYVAAGLHKTRKTSETLDTKPGIHVVSPKGKLVAYVETPEDTITNCSFGGVDLKTLFVTCGSVLLSIPTSIPGKASYRPDA